MSTTRVLRLGVFFDQIITTGGGYQQALNAILLVKQLPPDLVEPIYFTNHKNNINVLQSFGITALFIPNSLRSRICRKIRREISHPLFLKVWRRFFGPNSFERWFLNQNVDLVYFLAPTPDANDLEELNYITTVWDLCHRDDMEFPEVRAGRDFETRERYFKQVLPKATATLVESPLGKLNVIRRYGVDEDRVYVMPLSAALGTKITKEIYDKNFINIPDKYQLQVPYVFYPAQFWAHKNHVYLLQGLKHLEKKYGIKIGAIFSGGDKGNLAYLQKMSALLEIGDRVRFAGFVENEEIPYLYKQSLALVMPTYFGPNNVPPLEAFNLEVPVLYSDKPGLREQVGNAALLMDLNNPESMADHLFKLIEQPELRDQLTLEGKNILGQFSDAARINILTTILQKYMHRRICWE